MSKRFCACGAVGMANHFRCEACEAKHQAKYKAATNKYGNRKYDHRWDQLSRDYRRDHPLCEHCKCSGYVEPARQVHHIKPIDTHPELMYELSNLMAVCIPCHRVLDDANRAGASKPAVF